jgi:2-oxoglutarate ferredoxin oxidoreductase subunit beta
MSTPSPETRALAKKDFVSDQDVRWCPGCGDYAILSQVQKLLPELEIPRENFVFISGIGCSSRFPYYVDTFGFHSIHGRAPALATGLKATRPDLSVWVVTGDGDALSIGGNHLLHILRRNVDVNILLFNNRIYGLTKGQYSPTSELGKVTKSTPAGSPDYPIDPISIALGAEGTFVARSIDVDTKHLQQVIRRAVAHKGTSFVEILQNCNVFNDGVWANLSDKTTKDDTQLVLEHGQPLLFGKNRDKGIQVRDLRPKVVTVGKDATLAEVLVHDERNPALAYMLSYLRAPAFPTPVGVFTARERPTYERLLNEQIAVSRKTVGVGDLDVALRKGGTWTVS